MRKFSVALNMGTTLLAAILAAVLSATANNISEQCQVHNESRITCSCIGNEEFLLPEEYNYTKVISVSVTGCVTANLHFSSLPEATGLEEMIVQNISGHLDFDVFIASSRIKLLRLSNINRIPIIATHTFTTVMTIDNFEIEDTLIENFEEDLTYVNIWHLVMTNVTIERVNMLNFSEKGVTLRIANSELRNVMTSLNFANFMNIEIVNSRFELQKPDLVSIQADVVFVNNSVFTNASMNLVTTNAITINGICADGKSTLRVASKYIDSRNNKLPNEITYSKDIQNEEPGFITSQNNTVCKAGNCKCPKSSSGQATIVPMFALGCFLMASFSRYF